MDARLSPSLKKMLDGDRKEGIGCRSRQREPGATVFMDALSSLIHARALSRELHKSGVSGRGAELDATVSMRDGFCGVGCNGNCGGIMGIRARLRETQFGDCF
jgi:hypothetical protein